MIKNITFALLIIILLSVVIPATATENLVSLGSDEERQKWIEELEKDGLSTEEIAKRIIDQISQLGEINSSPDPVIEEKFLLEKKIQEMANNIDVIEVDDTFQSTVPYYWVILIADDKQKKIFISEIEESEISVKDKIELKSRLLEIWKAYPMKFEKIGHTTYISPDTKNKEIILTESENLTLQQVDLIYSFKDNITLITPKWACSPSHYDLVYYAALNSGYPDPVTAAQHSGDPDDNFPWDAPEMWYNPDSQIGGAPGMAQQSFDYARGYYQLGNVSGASIWIGRSSHYLTDVGNPLHTGREWDQIRDYLLHFLTHDDVHSLYESYVSTHWDDFDSWVMGNQYIYKWDWNDGADDSTIAVATSSHRFVDTLWTKIYNNRAGFWNEDDWTREITRICFMTSSQYNNGLIDAVMLKPIPGCENLPTDPDLDRDIEDLNGNGGIDYDDVVLYFHYLEWIQENEPIVPFDYNNNGFIDFDDLVRLYNEL
jgi:hypothetical protein